MKQTIILFSELCIHLEKMDTQAASSNYCHYQAILWTNLYLVHSIKFHNHNNCLLKFLQNLR